MSHGLGSLLRPPELCGFSVTQICLPRGHPATTEEALTAPFLESLSQGTTSHNLSIPALRCFPLLSSLSSSCPGSFHVHSYMHTPRPYTREHKHACTNTCPRIHHGSSALPSGTHVKTSCSNFPVPQCTECALLFLSHLLGCCNLLGGHQHFISYHFELLSHDTALSIL